MIFYDEDDLCRVVSRGARLLELDLTADGAREVARRSRGTPRVAGRLLRRVRDFAHVDGNAEVNAEVADAALSRLGVDTVGLDAMDRRYMRYLAENCGGGPAGVETLGAALAEQRDVLEDVIEPYLIQQGLLQRTPRGRMLTMSGWRYLGLEAPQAVAEQLELLSTSGPVGDEDG